MSLRATTAAAIAVLIGMLTALAVATSPPAAAAAAPGAPHSSAAAGPDRPFRTAPAQQRQRRGGPIGAGKLKRKLKSLARQAPGASGYYVFDLDAKRKRVLFDRSGGHSRKLASNEKLFTTMTAMHRLGPKSRIVTKVKARGRVGRKGRLGGDIYLVGAGDPTFGSRGVASLAKQVHKAGIRRVKGTVIGDDSVFDRRRGVPDTNYAAGVDIAPLSGLTYGGSTYDGDPAKEAARKFRNALRRAGVKVGGKVKVGRIPGSVRNEDALAAYGSPRIKSIVRATNKDSINFYAEMLLKRLWAEPGRKGTTNGGVKAVERFAKQLGSKVRARDGSGLTDNNRASPRNVVRLLAAARRDHELAKPLFKSLSIAGQDGTLANRMGGSVAAGSCRGKTGTIHAVSNLSGYCKSHGRLIAFSLLMNGVTSYDYARSLQDKMVIQIARYR
jgi:D-alanyl-D-alanine carboxypeptidase/D-alanyl-D-alanine-endopeptidase (penicillin-binding protein 4)